ncbi:MAG: glycosyltransferase [Chloroflexia bacterium]
MRVLVVSPYLPYPPNHGGKIRVFELLRRVARRHDVTLATLLEAEEEQAHVRVLEELGLRVLSAYKQPVRNSIAAKAQRFFDPRPRSVSEYDSQELRTLIGAFVQEYPPDIIQCEQVVVAHYASLYSAIPRLLVEQNIEYQLLLEIARARPQMISRLAGRLDAWKARRFEQHAWKNFTGYATMSEHDRAVLLRHAPAAQVYVVPNGVDTDYFRPTNEACEPETLIITGNFGYYPNLDGITWFLSDILPGIRAEHPGVELRIVGQGNAALEQRVGRPDGVILTGWVEDVRPYVARSVAFVAPLRIGGGTRLKILEAMAQGIPVISTGIGCQGLDVVDGEHLLVADTPERFTLATSRLLRDSTLRQRLKSNALRLVVERYDWERIVEKLETVYADLVAAPTSTPGYMGNDQ